MGSSRNLRSTLSWCLNFLPSKPRQPPIFISPTLSTHQGLLPQHIQEPDMDLMYTTFSAIYFTIWHIKPHHVEFLSLLSPPPFSFPNHSGTSVCSSFVFLGQVGTQKVCWDVNNTMKVGQANCWYFCSSFTCHLCYSYDTTSEW